MKIFIIVLIIIVIIASLLAIIAGEAINFIGNDSYIEYEEDEE